VTNVLNSSYEFCPAEMMASNPLWCVSNRMEGAVRDLIHSSGEKGI
jgi:CBS domain-containing protein